MSANGPANGESLRETPLSSDVTVGVVVRGEFMYGGGGPFIIAPTIILFDDGGGGDGNRSRSDRCSTGDRLGVGARVPIPCPPLPEPKPVPPAIMVGPVIMGVLVLYRDPPPLNVEGLGGGRVRCIGGDRPDSPLGRGGARDDDAEADGTDGGGPCEV